MEDLRHPSYLSSSESLFVPIDPFKPSVAYGLKRLATSTVLHDNRPQVNRRPIRLSQEASVPPDAYIPHPDHDGYIQLPPPHEIANLTDSTISTPLPQRTTTDQRASSPAPFRNSPVENTSFGVSNNPRLLSLIREDEFPRLDISPQYSRTEIPRLTTQRDFRVAGSRIRRTSTLPYAAMLEPKKDTQHPPYGLNKVEKEPTIQSHGSSSPSFKKEIALSTYLLAFIFDSLPRQIYLHLLLRLPYLYFSRVTRIFQDAEMSMPEIKKMALEVSASNDPATFRNFDALIMNSSPRYVNLQRSWGLFIDSLLREWKTLNIISVLLLSAILTILQIPSAADDPVTRYTSLLSMISALMSLLYGCVFIIRFGTMRTTYKAAEWAQEAQQSRTNIFWNVWVLLAMPTIWLAWSIIMFCVCIMSFVWRTGTTDDVDRAPLTARGARAPRIVITVVFVLGIIYFVLIASTLRRYGEAMDRAWRARMMSWAQEKVHRVEDTLRHYSRAQSPSGNGSPRNVRNQRAASSMDSLRSETPVGIDISVMPPSRPTSPLSLASSQQPYNSIKESDSPPKPVRLKLQSLHQIPHITSADDETSSITPTDSAAGDRHSTEGKFQVVPQINVTKLFSVSPDSASIIFPLADEASLLVQEGYKLVLEVHSMSNWNITTKTLNIGKVKEVVQRWNDTFFLERGGQIQLCEELIILDNPPDTNPVVGNIRRDNTGTDSGGGHTALSRHAIYHFSWKDELPHDPRRYKSRSWPEDLRQVDILYHPSGVPSTSSAVDSEDNLSPSQNRILLIRIPDIRPPITGLLT